MPSFQVQGTLPAAQTLQTADGECGWLDQWLTSTFLELWHPVLQHGQTSVS